MTPLTALGRGLANLLTLRPRRAHRHLWDDLHCDPAMCSVCGKRGYARCNT